MIEKSRVRLLFRREPVVSNGTDNVVLWRSICCQYQFCRNSRRRRIHRQHSSACHGFHRRWRTHRDHRCSAAAGRRAGCAARRPSGQHRPTARSCLAAARPRPLSFSDAAHGGYETGAVLSPTLLEKNVNLALARRLQKELEARGIPVVLTRVADNLLTWDQRAVSANTSHASLYIALHSSGSGHGVRVYTSDGCRAAGRPEQAQFLALGAGAVALPRAVRHGCLGAGRGVSLRAALPVRSSAAPCVRSTTSRWRRLPLRLRRWETPQTS